MNLYPIVTRFINLFKNLDERIGGHETIHELEKQNFLLQDFEEEND